MANHLGTTKRKIALIGSAPSSINLAPYRQPDWFIMGCSPGAYGVAGPHADAWVELHRFEPQIPGHVGTGQPWFSPEYCEFLFRHSKVFIANPIPGMNGGVVYPFDEMIEKFGPYFMTSSLSWMLALAIEQDDVEEIALFGVDMAAHEEYATQRPGCQYFLTLAIQRGIKITIPPESDLLQPPFLYGFGETSPMMIKLTARKKELESRLAGCDQQMAAAQRQGDFLRGAIDDIDYMIKTWVTHQTMIEPRDVTKQYKSRLPAGVDLIEAALG